MNLDLTKEIEQLKEFKLIDIDKFNAFCHDVDSRLYNINEYYDTNTIDKDELEKFLSNLKEFNKLLNKIYAGHETKFMIRLSCTIDEIINKKFNENNR